MMGLPRLKWRQLFGAVLAINLISSGGPWLCFAQAQQAQEQPGGKGGTPGHTAELEGTVVKVSPGTASMVIEWKGIAQEIRYTEKTKVTYRSKTASVGEIKEGAYVAISGTFNDRKQLVAERIDAAPTSREKK
jgi:hypothetical protein